jgi:HSP20 family protein
MKLIPTQSKRNDLSTLRGQIENLNRWMDEDFGWNIGSRLPAAFQSLRVPPVDVAETEHEFLVSVELPGLEEKDIQIEMMGDNLCISGERKWESEKKGKEFHRVETQFGAFRRDVRLPPGLRNHPEDIKAVYKNGVLEIRIPKVEPTPAARIPVKKA